MPKVNAETLKRVQDALEKYEMEVSDAPLSPNSKKTYILHARNFVRWLDDDFEPGSSFKR